MEIGLTRVIGNKLLSSS